jgi:hypothetical protein
MISDNGQVLVTSFMALPDLTDPQKLGSCITYYRRYSLVSLLALEAEDDDGNTASGAVQVQATQDFEAQGLVRFNAPYMANKDDFAKLTGFLKQNGGKFDSVEKCWWVSQDLAIQLQDKLNNK